MRKAIFALAAILLATPAFACSDPAAIAGDFQTGDKGWGEPDAQFQVTGAEAALAPQPGTQTARWDAGKPLGSLEACVTIAMPESTADASRGYAGLLFWGVDKDDFYQAVISRNGMVAVARKVGGRILAAPPVNWMPTSALKLGANEKNTLKVRIEGETVAVSVNGTEVARFRGQPPAAPSYVGLVASSAPSAVDTWRMTDFKVAEIAPPASVSAGAEVPPGEATRAVRAAAATAAETTVASTDCGAGPMLFEDRFSDHDPMWGAKDAEVSLAGGQAELDPTPGASALRWNRAFVFTDLDACAAVSLDNATVNPTASYAGLLFWVQDSRNYYQAVLAPNGYFTVARIVDGKVVAKRPVPWTKLAAVKTGAKARNVLRVSVKGGEVALFVNGKPSGSFRGEPPTGPSYIGMLAASAASKKGDTWTISDLKVTAPQ